MTQKTLKQKQGFALVELIVVLVIIGFLAAMLMPALTGFVDGAREKQAMAEARNALLAGKASYVEYYANIGAVPPGGTEATKKFIGPYFQDLLKSKCGMNFSTRFTLRAVQRAGNVYAIETGWMTTGGAEKLMQLIRTKELGGNCVEFYVKPKTFDSFVGLNYLTKDRQYIVTIILEPENTKDYKDVAPGTYIIKRIE